MVNVELEKHQFHQAVTMVLNVAETCCCQLCHCWNGYVFSLHLNVSNIRSG